jgi:hypothetical protein
MEQCWRDLLQTTWDLKGDNDEFQRRLPGGELIRINAPCCNQFLLSREVVRRRPLHVWMDLLNMIGVREVCHEGELDYENLWSYHRWGMVSGPEPATYFVTTPIGNAKPQEGTTSHHHAHNLATLQYLDRNAIISKVMNFTSFIALTYLYCVPIYALADTVGRYMQGCAMEALSHVVFGHQPLVMDTPSQEVICANFLRGCPGSPCLDTIADVEEVIKKNNFRFHNSDMAFRSGNVVCAPVLCVEIELQEINPQIACSNEWDIRIFLSTGNKI